MKLLRFERKIVAAMFAVAIVPLVASLVLGRVALQDTYAVGVNPRVHAQLDEALGIYRSYLSALRDDAERTADAIAFDWRLHDALAANDVSEAERMLQAALERNTNVGQVVVRTRDGQDIVRVESAASQGASNVRALTLERPLLDLSSTPVVEVTVTTPTEPFVAYRRAGEVAEVYGRLEEGSEFVSRSYLAVYLGFLLAVIVLGLAVGIVLSRRVTRRVADLANATERVGAGDLTVQVPVGARDEVGELTSAFNAMVRDLRESRERIDYLQRISAWQEFARRLAHEIKNPLTPIQLAAQEMHESYRGDDARHRRALEDARSIIQEEVATLRRLVGEFSAFAKLPEAELAGADLRDFVREIEPSIASIPEMIGLETVVVRTETPDQPVPVSIDAMMLKRCVDNLVRNAAQAIGASGRAGEVLVNVRVEGERALLEVADDGPGVPDAARARVFDPYYTTKSDGTGLGLAIVKKVVLEHGGEIGCYPREPSGAIFRIALPLGGTARPGRISRVPEL